jgi:peptidyl-prolyl cis-trans isomerase B (cyclophilin B)
MRILSAAMLALVIASPVWAQGLELSVAPITTAEKPLLLNDVIEVEVTLTNKGEAPVEKLKSLVFDRQSVSFEVAFEKLIPSETDKTKVEKVWGSSFRDERLSGNWTFKSPKPGEPAPAPGEEWQLEPKVLDVITLEKGAKASCRVSMPLLKSGKIKIIAVYRGAASELRSAEAVVEVQPKNGQTQSQVTIVTDRGSMRCVLFLDEAPRSCLNFARLVHEKFYNGNVIHRVSKSLTVIQGGCPQGTGAGGPGYFVPAEFSARRHSVGSLAMARSGANDSAGSQFYLTGTNQPSLDNRYTVFGQQMEQWSHDVLQVLLETETKAGSETPVSPPRLRRVEMFP